METQLKIEGVLTPSPAGLQPRAYYAAIQGGRYHLECSVSGLRTAKLPTLQEAVEQWEKLATEAKV